MAIKTYKKGDSTNIAANFRAREFDCNGKGCCNETLIDEKLVQYLQKIREHFGKPLYLTGYRCAVHNAKTPNAAPNSRHTKGMAADFHIDGVAPAEIAKYAESIGVKGIGLYDTFVHIDTRETKSFWYGHGQEYRSTFGGAPVEDEKTFALTFRQLRKGMEGDDVKALQQLLIANGKNCGGKGADGKFGVNTEAALIYYQCDHGLAGDGVAGPATMSSLYGVK